MGPAALVGRPGPARPTLPGVEADPVIEDRRDGRRTPVGQEGLAEDRPGPEGLVGLGPGQWAAAAPRVLEGSRPEVALAALRGRALLVARADGPAAPAAPVCAPGVPGRWVARVWGLGSGVVRKRHTAPRLGPAPALTAARLEPGYLPAGADDQAAAPAVPAVAVGAPVAAAGHAAVDRTVKNCRPRHRPRTRRRTPPCLKAT